MHPVLFLECKHAKRHTLWTLWRQVKDRARKENRVPVVGLQEANCPGCLLVVHTDDLPVLIREWLLANREHGLDFMETINLHCDSSLQKEGNGKPSPKPKNHPSPVVGSGVDGQYRIEVVSGPEGPCLVFGDQDVGRRISGPKPWGGGKVTHAFPLKQSDLEELRDEIDKAITELRKEPNAAPANRRPYPRPKVRKRI